MKFTRQSTEQRHLIRAYAANSVQVGERRLQSSCLVSAQHLEENWSPRHASELTFAHLEIALDWQPDIILLGTGMRQIFPASELIATVMARGVGFEVMDLGAACRTFNVLVGEDRRVVAALLL